MTTYPLGAKVTFLDANATTSTGEEGVAVGTVNGPILEIEGHEIRVPVFASRDNMREPTTIYVAASNILNVEGS